MYDLELDIWDFDLWILSFQCFALYAFSFTLELGFELHGIPQLRCLIIF